MSGSNWKQTTFKIPQISFLTCWQWVWYYDNPYKSLVAEFEMHHSGRQMEKRAKKLSLNKNIFMHCLPDDVKKLPVAERASFF